MKIRERQIHGCSCRSVQGCIHSGHWSSCWKRFAIFIEVKTRFIAPLCKILWSGKVDLVAQTKIINNKETRGDFILDDTTLSGLKAAFKTAPSSELAKILLLELLLRREPIAEYNFLRYMDATLSESELENLTRALLQSGNKNQLSEFIQRTLHPRLPALVEQLIQDKETDQAQTLYQCLIDVDPAFKREKIEQSLGLPTKATDEQEQAEIDSAKKVTKLRVVEKVDMGEVTDLTRYKQSTTTFDDVVGLENIKKQIHKKIIMPFQKPSLFQRFKKKIGGGVMLYGPPGCGKTLLARATAGECKAQFFNIEISDVLDMYIGESEQKLRAIFEKARASAPSVLFFDELEALAGKREHTRNSTTSHVISQFLTELDGFEQANSGVLVLASTNVPWSVDSAFLRPGRFDRMFFVPPPDKIARAAILQHHMKERPSIANIDYATLAAKTAGYSGADLANLVEMAADEAIDDSLMEGQEVAINQEHFLNALQESRSTTTEWLTTARNYARYANDGGRYNDVLEFLNKHGK